MALTLRMLKEGTNFAIGDRVCVVLDKNESEIKIRILSGLDTGKVIGWSLGTEIDRIVPQSEMQKETQEFLCPVCHKVCFSSSGFTLHKKQHTKEEWATVVGAVDLTK